MAIKNWERIHNTKANSLVIASHLDGLQNNLPLETTIKEIFTKNGMLDVYLSKRDNPEENKISIANLLLKRLIDQFNQVSTNIIGESSKLRILHLTNSNTEMEKYLTQISNAKHRGALSQLRLSSHSLEIERGRYTQTPPEHRFCAYCKDIIGKNIVENEEHFIFYCPMSEELSRQFMPNSGTKHAHMTDEQKLVHLLNGKKEIHKMAKYLYLAFEHRKTTLDVLKYIQNLTAEVECQVKDKKVKYKISKVSNAGLKTTLMKIA